MDQEQRIKNLENAMQQMTQSYWRFQGRINALELFAGLTVFDFANLQPNPFQWVQDYTRNMGAMIKTLTPDVDDPSKGEQLKRETTIAIEEFLEHLLAKAGQLKGAPPRSAG